MAMGNQRPSRALPGKHVPSSAPAAAVRDLSADLQRHRDRPDASKTEPPGGYPETAGGNPDAPAERQSSDDGMTGVAVAAPGPYSLATRQAPMGGAANVARGSY